MAKTPQIFGEQTWVLVREAYLRGMKAKDCEKLYGPMAQTIRARALRGGWTRKAHARELDKLRARAAPPPEPFPGYGAPDAVIPHHIPHLEAPPPENLSGDALDPDAMLREAALAARRAIAGGRAAEAVNLIKAAEGLAALASRIAPCPPLDAASPSETEENEPELDDHGRTRGERGFDLIYAMAYEMAGEVALELISENPSGPAVRSRFIYGWRADHMPPEVTARDFRKARDCGVSNRIFDEEGKVLPILLPFDYRKDIESRRRPLY